MDGFEKLYEYLKREKGNRSISFFYHEETDSLGIKITDRSDKCRNKFGSSLINTRIADSRIMDLWGFGFNDIIFMEIEAMSKELDDKILEGKI